MNALVPMFDPAGALQACQLLEAQDVPMQPDSSVRIGGTQPGVPPQRVHVVAYVVTAWTEVHRSGQAGPDTLPSLSSGAPAPLLQLLDCLVGRGVTVAAAEADTEASSPLLVATHARAPALTRWLLDHGATPSAPASADDPFTALHAAVANRVET